MKTQSLGLQDAVEHVANMCRETLQSYYEYKTKIPSWSPEIDQNVAEYIRGIEDWIAGTFHWTFMSERYFGKKHDEVKRTGIVELLPPRRARANAA